MDWIKFWRFAGKAGGNKKTGSWDNRSHQCNPGKKGAKIGILTTKGFRDVLIIGRGTRNELYNVHFDSKPPVFFAHGNG